VIALTVFVDLIGFGIVIPIIPFYAQALGGSPTVLGLIIASYSLVQSVFSPVLGRLSDRFGRKPVILASIAASTVGYLIFALSDSLFLLFLSRVIAGMGGANLSVAQAYVADSTSHAERVRWMGVVGASFGVGFIVGPTISGFLSVYGFSAPGFAATAIASTNLVLASTLLPESLPSSLRDRRRTGASAELSFLGILRRPVVGALLVTFFVATFSFATIPVIYPLLGAAYFNIGPRDMSFIFAYIGVILILVQAIMIRRLVRWLGEGRLLAASTALMTTSMFATPFIPSLAIFLVLTGLMTVGASILNSLIPSLISKRSHFGEQGKVLGVTQAVASIARVPGPLTGGLVLEYAGLIAPFITAAGLMLLGFILSLRVKLATPPHS